MALGACLADDMGLGKTIQTIAFLLHLKEQGALEQPTLVWTSVLGNWERESKIWLTLKVLMHHGDKRPKGKAFTSAQREFGNYELCSDSGDVKELQSIGQTIVLDEAKIKKSERQKQSQSVQLQSSFRLHAGTPVEKAKNYGRFRFSQSRVTASFSAPVCDAD